MADGEVRVEITGDSSRLEQALKNAEKSTEQTAESIKKIDEAAQKSIDSTIDLGTAVQNNLDVAADNAADIVREVKNLGDAIDSAGNSTVTFGDLLKANILSDYVREGINKLAGAFGDFVKKGVDLASDLQEVQNVVDTTFGDGANQIYAWADAAAESFGMSSLSAQQYNGTMGAMLKSMGLADDAVIKMSTDMVGLAGDMASFYNLDIEQAFEKIRSGISGETEPLKQLGINMSVANLEAYALAQGIETAYDKMSQSEQAVLRYNYLMSVTADAQGDFAKTSDSFANQQRILQLQIDNLSASLGEKLLPHLNDVVGTVIDKLPQAERSIENIGEILGAATSFALEHHEAIIFLVTAYGTFYGVIDLTNHNTVCIDFYGYCDYSTSTMSYANDIAAYFRVDRPKALPQSNKAYDWSGWDNIGMNYRKRGKYYFDVSQLTSKHDLCFGIFHGTYQTGYTNGIKIYEMVLM